MEMMRLSRFTRFSLGLAAFVIALVGCGGSSDHQKDASKPDSRDSVVVTLTGRDSVSVFDLLKARHHVDYMSSAMGVFVSGIDSVVNGNGHYWVYSVNDTMGSVASNKYVTHDSDRVVWHFRGPKK